MDFLEYRIQFIDQARGLGYQDGEIENLLDYAQSLYDKGLPIIYDQEHLSLLLGYDYSFLLAISNSQQYFFYLCTRKQVQTNWLTAVKVDYLVF